MSGSAETEFIYVTQNICNYKKINKQNSPLWGNKLCVLIL